MTDGRTDGRMAAPDGSLRTSVQMGCTGRTWGEGGVRTEELVAVWIND